MIGIRVTMNRKTRMPIVTINTEIMISIQWGTYRWLEGSCQLNAIREILSRFSTMPRTVQPAVHRMSLTFLSRTPMAYIRQGKATNPSSSTRNHAP